jgi:tryptophanyl-tRNA synthetase
MPTDPARVHRTDPGNPDKCPVWDFHLVYSDQEKKEWVQNGCRSAKIGCLECKQPIIDAVLTELKPIQERAAEFSRDPLAVKNIIAVGNKRAQEAAEDTLAEVRAAIGLGYNG